MRALRQFLVLGRVGLAPFTAVPWFTGGAVAGAGAPALAALVCGGLALHIVACLVNDLADLAADRTNPARRGSPLVSGAVAQVQVAWWVLLLVTALTAGCCLLPTSRWATAGLVCVLLLTLWGNLFQKKSRRVPPPVVDHLFGLAMAATLPLAALAAGGRPSVAVVAVAVAFALQMVVMNATVGGLKDLDVDRAAGARTTAIVLGVRRRAPAGLTVPRPFRVYVLSAQLGSVPALAVASPAAAALAATATAALPLALRRVAAGERTGSPLRRVGFVLGNAAAFLVGCAALLRDRPAAAAALLVVVAALAGTAARRRARARSVDDGAAALHQHPQG
ncbi:UbiA family prenyltransferase [Micromonosporaceae bacterium B7E4]